MEKKQIIFFSGGLSSWMTSQRVIEEYGTKNLILVFTDTLIEDEDLYRFLLETSQEIFNIDQSELIEEVKKIPPITHKTMDDRKEFLRELAKKTNDLNKNFIWLSDGRDPWDVFRDERWIGNSQIAHCSHKLKQEMSERWIKDNYKPDECVLYLGIDWMEEHRVKKPVRKWDPYQVKFPMVDPPFLTKIDIIKELEKLNINVPRIYGMDFDHNNCSGFCVRGGQGHFVNLLEKNRPLFLYHEQKEQEMREFLGRDDVAILRRQRNKVRKAFPLRELRLEYEERNGEGIDKDDIGGCGCFVD